MFPSASIISLFYQYFYQRSIASYRIVLYYIISYHISLRFVGILAFCLLSQIFEYVIVNITFLRVRFGVYYGRHYPF